MEENELSLENLFNKEAQKPFYYNISFKELTVNSKDIDIFNHLKEIFAKGLLIVTDNNLKSVGTNGVDIGKMSEKDFKKVRERFLSLGIDVKHRRYDESDKDYYLRRVCYNAQDIKGLKLEVTMDWKSQYVNKVLFKAENKEILPELMRVIEDTPESNYFLELAKPKNLKDYIIKYSLKTEPKILHVINFDMAKLSDYHYQHAMCTAETRHIR
jgi:hypothetical protein